jgi:hypothetical protein
LSLADIVRNVARPSKGDRAAYMVRARDGLTPQLAERVAASTIGAALAQRLRVPFADADDFHPPANVARTPQAAYALPRELRDGAFHTAIARQYFG